MSEWRIEALAPLLGHPLRGRPAAGGYSIKGYARMTDEQAEAILKECVWEED